MTVEKEKAYTTKQQGDACEMLVAAELTLHGVPALKVPDGWPEYDVIAQPVGAPLQKISVKSYTFTTKSADFIGYKRTDEFDRLAIVILPGSGCDQRRIFIVPREVADADERSYYAERRDGRGIRVNRIIETFGDYENNFSLSREPTAT
jgi:hypothetical protein